MTPKFLARASGRMQLPFTELTVGGTGLEEGNQELSIGYDKCEMPIRDLGEQVVKQFWSSGEEIWLETQMWKSLGCGWYFLSHKIE